MKTKAAPLARFLIPALCGMFAASASAATIINNSTLNGSFESGASGTPDVDNTVDNWTTGLNAEANQFTTTLTPPDGAYSAVLGEQNAAGGGATLGVIQNTGYTVALGDTFDFSFQWRAAFNWDSADTVNWRLFTTDDNTVGGVLTAIASDSFTGTNTTFSLQDYSGVGTVVAANVGQQLWVEIWGVDAGTLTNGTFSRIDAVALTAVPEPSAAALIFGGFGLVALLRRRR